MTDVSSSRVDKRNSIAVLPRIGVWPFRRIDWESIEAAQDRRREARKHEQLMVREWHAFDVALSSMTNEQALRTFSELCRGRRWTQSQSDEICGLARMTEAP